MTQYIDKSAVVAEIEKRIKKYASIDVGGNEIYEALYGEKCKTLIEIFRFLDTLEVKEVDLEKEIKDYIHALPHAKTGVPNGWRLSWHEDEVMKIAKHFFELGLKAKGEVYVVTRSEEHADYVEAVFLSESKAEKYCKPFNENENSYGRNITKIKIQ